MRFQDAVGLIGSASRFAELVAQIQSRAAGNAAVVGAGDAYRILVKLVHPDAVSAAERVTASAAFAKLSRLYAERSTRSGDICDLFERGDGLLKIPRSPRDNDMMTAEAEALRQLRREGHPKFFPYAPELLDSFVHEDGQRRHRVVNVIERLDGFVPLSRVSDLDPRDAAWMWRRLLVALGWAHRAGVVHGAVFEEHVLIHPAEHGVALVDWCYAGATPRAVIKSHRDDYPPEVVDEKRATAATDIYLATGLMKRLIGPRMPAPMRRFVRGCMYAAPRMRPQDAWRLLEELDELLHSLYGPRTFRPFTL